MGEGQKVMKLKDTFHNLTENQRLYGLNIPIIALTGGIASGKSTVSQMLIEKGLSLIDADKLVKTIYQSHEARDFIQNNFPEAISSNEINFPLLRQKVFCESQAKKKIETFIYERLPTVFNNAFKKLSSPDFLIYDIPLLFEKNMTPLFDLNVLVYAPRNIQKMRLMQRDSLSEAAADQILNQQMNIEEKKLRSSFVIDNSSTKKELAIEVENFLQQVLDDY